jgi:putative acetyltransferase
MILRDETPEDAAAVRQVVADAFSQAAEADLVEALRASGDAVISLVAEDDGEIAVAPGRQNQGIGSALVREGLARAKRDGWQAVFVVGEPDYYGRFGFSAAAAAKFETAYPKPYVLALELVPNALTTRTGALLYALAFQALE